MNIELEGEFVEYHGIPWFRMARNTIFTTSGGVLKKPKDGLEVQVYVSNQYNGGIIVNDRWVAGIEVPAACAPTGFMLDGSIGCGLQLNSRPPLATRILRAIKEIKPLKKDEYEEQT